MNEYISELSWDSEFFKQKIGSSTVLKPTEELISQIVEEGRKKQFDLLYIFIPGKYTRRKRFVSSLGGRLVDTKVTFKKKVTHQNVSSFSSDPHIHSYLEKKSTKQLNKLAVQAGHMSRFYKDKNIPRKLYHQLYETWVEKSLTGEMADNVLVYQEKKRIVGFITYKITKSTGKIGLIAVSKSSRGKSIGTKLMEKAIFEMQQKRVSTVYVVTQLANISACAFYQKNGYDIYKKEYVFHVWL